MLRSSEAKTKAMQPVLPDNVSPHKTPDDLMKARKLMDLIQEQELMEKEGLENSKKALDYCMEALKKDPDSFEANWMTAKTCWFYAMYAKELYLADWEDTCRRYGKMGITYAEKAIALNPEKVQGHFWYGMNAGIYTDSVSMLTAILEGLKGKVQQSFELSYKYDKYYEHGGPIAALGRFWAVLPWPLKDKKKAMKYYREFYKSKFFGRPYTVQFHVYYAELLMEDSNTRDEAKTLLKEVPKISKNKYWRDQAKKLLADLE